MSVTAKPYRCTHCEHVRMVQTNHWGEVYSRCPNCSWKRPIDATVSVPVGPVPEGAWVPEPWQQVRLGDVAEIHGGGKVRGE